ncbi:MAG: hypothetical protein MRY78_11515 [Saprospiraceae bacterium]|nr:hypothetical protein [Saprospiraceae bacterium]
MIFRFLIIFIFFLSVSRSNSQNSNSAPWLKNIEDFLIITNNVIESNIISDEDYKYLKNEYLDKVFINENATIGLIFRYAEKKGKATTNSIKLLKFINNVNKYPQSSFSIDLSKAIFTKIGFFPEVNLSDKNRTRLSRVDANATTIININFEKCKGQKIAFSIPMRINFFCYWQLGRLKSRIFSMKIINEDDPDNDGFLTNDDFNPDLCPFTNGVVKGCLDWDGDGFHNGNGKWENLSTWDDQCPFIPGLANGCPDQDGDGIADKDESNSCIGIAGDKITGYYQDSFYGCPDTDRDNVPDYLDKCPDTYGEIDSVNVNLNGCPNIDRDSLNDLVDLCPCHVGELENNGCPDADGDGVWDFDDECPTVAGTGSDGCPQEFFSFKHLEQIVPRSDPINYMKLVWDEELLVVGSQQGYLYVVSLDNEKGIRTAFESNNRKKIGQIISVDSQSSKNTLKIYSEESNGNKFMTKVEAFRDKEMKIYEPKQVPHFEQKQKLLEGEDKKPVILVQKDKAILRGNWPTSNTLQVDTIYFKYSGYQKSLINYAFSADNRYVVFAEMSGAGRIEIWKRKSPKINFRTEKWLNMKAYFPSFPKDIYPTHLIFNKNGELLFVGTKGYLYIFKRQRLS